MSEEEAKGTLYLVATPIGNLEDMSHRAVRVLGEVDALACEDTRVTPRLLERYGIAKPRTFFSYHEHNEEMAGRRILGLLNEGLSVALCSDGGAPAISDPGYRIIRDAIAAGHAVVPLPGPSAVHAALLASGLPTNAYTFKGFPPRKSGARQRFFLEEAASPHTLVIFESPHRVAQCLTDARAVLGDRQAAICIELTKKFERVDRGFLSGLTPWYTNHRVRGEVTIVIAGQHAKFVRGDDGDEDLPGDGETESS
jgi:16S rRNA (cytidine1402-2'-O)-methyltransferase